MLRENFPLFPLVYLLGKLFVHYALMLDFGPELLVLGFELSETAFDG